MQYRMVVESFDVCVLSSGAIGELIDVVVGFFIVDDKEMLDQCPGRSVEDHEN